MEAKPTVYLETSVIGYATSRPSRDLVVAAHQQITPGWFAGGAEVYELFVSQLVIRDASSGDEGATMRHNIERACREAGYELPVICTPEELTNDHED